MKKHVLLILASALLAPALQSQNLLYEQEYTRNPVTPSDVHIIPLKDGGLFMAYYRSPKAAIKSSQVLVEFDKDKKKVFEKNTEVTSEFKNKDMNFVYNPTNGYVYGIYTYTKKGASLADIMILQRDGAYSSRAGIPTPPHVTNAFMWGNELVLLGLNNETVKQPSGEYEAVILKSDLSTNTPKKLTIPSFTNVAGSIKNRLIATDSKNLYFVTETQSATDGKTTYDFTKYDWNENKIVATKTVALDLGENTKRESTANLQSINPDLLIFTDHLDGYPNVAYNKAENAFFLMGSYGKGYTTYEAGREHAGNYLVRLNTNFDVEWKTLMAPAPEITTNKIYTAYTSKHQIQLTGKGKNYFVCNASDGGQYQGSISEIDLKTGKEKMNQAVNGENTGLILARTINKDNTDKIPDLQVKTDFKPYFVQNGESTYMIINHEKKTKIYVYGF